MRRLSLGEFGGWAQGHTVEGHNPLPLYRSFWQGPMLHPAWDVTSHARPRLTRTTVLCCSQAGFRGGDVSCPRCCGWWGQAGGVR